MKSKLLVGLLMGLVCFAFLHFMAERNVSIKFGNRSDYSVSELLSEHKRRIIGTKLTFFGHFPDGTQHDHLCKHNKKATYNKL